LRPGTGLAVNLRRVESSFVLVLLSLAVVPAFQLAFAASGCAFSPCPTSAQASVTAASLPGGIFAYTFTITNTSPQGYGVNEFLVNLQYNVPDGTFPPLSGIASVAITTQNVPSGWDCGISTSYGALICDVVGGAGPNPGLVVAPLQTAQVTFTSTTIPPASLPFGANFFTLGPPEQSGFDFNDYATVTLTVTPVADAGPDQYTSPGIVVVLDGSSSYDPKGDTLTYSWVQTVGPTVTLTGASTPAPSFTAPPVTSSTILTFQLTVSVRGISSSDAVDVTDVPSTIFSFGAAVAPSPGNPNYNAEEPTVAASGSSVYVVWLNIGSISGKAGTVGFARSRDAGTTFDLVKTLSPPASVCTPFDCDAKGTGQVPPVVASSGDHVYVAWADYYHGPFFASSANGGSTFSTPVNVVPVSGANMGTTYATHVGIAADTKFVYLLSECIHCGGQSASELSFSVSSDFGQSFSTRSLSDASGITSSQMAVSQNNVYIVWSESIAGYSVIEFVNSTNNGQTFSAKSTLSIPTHNSQFPKIALSGNNVYVGWNDKDAMQVVLRISPDGGKTFGSQSTLFSVAPGVGGPLDVIVELTAYGSDVYALSSVKGSASSITFAASNTDGANFAPQQTLDNSPLFHWGTCCSYPHMVGQGSGAFVVWWFVPPSSSNGDVAFTYSTDNGVSFGGPVNLSNSPGSTSLTSVDNGGYNIDEMVASSGRVYVVWFEPGNAGTLVVKLATGALVPSTLSVSSSGAASTSVTNDPSGSTVVSQTDASGNLLTSVTLPPGSSAPTGAMSLTYSTAGSSNQVQVSGVTLPPGGSKSITFLVDAAANAVCINDEPSPATLTATACTNGPGNIPYNLACSAGTVTSSGPLGFPAGTPSPRTFTCTILQGASGTYMLVTGLAFSSVQSMVSPVFWPFGSGPMTILALSVIACLVVAFALGLRKSRARRTRLSRQPASYPATGT